MHLDYLDKERKWLEKDRMYVANLKCLLSLETLCNVPCIG